MRSPYPVRVRRALTTGIAGWFGVVPVPQGTRNRIVAPSVAEARAVGRLPSARTHVIDLEEDEPPRLRLVAALRGTT
jgi:hypothetical protein